MQNVPVTHHRVTVNGIAMHYAAAGPQDGPVVVLLHGFPEFWYAWRHQLPALARAGYRVIAPDLRGYNETDKPQGIDAYRLPRLVDDIHALIHQTGGTCACVVGHDWGGVIAWALAATHPGDTRRLAVLNAPHPRAYHRELKRGARQWLRSWYALFFQLPHLPERALASPWWNVGRLLRSTSVRPDAFTDADVERYRAALRDPRARTAMLNYYRAAFRHPADSRIGVVSVPTLVIWGEQDVALVPDLANDLSAWVPNVRVHRLPHASHWVQHDDPVRVNTLILGFLDGNGR